MPEAGAEGGIPESVATGTLGRSRGALRLATYPMTRKALRWMLASIRIPPPRSIARLWQQWRLQGRRPRLRQLHDLRRVARVADRGMMSEDNIAAKEAEGMHFIVGAMLKQLPGEQNAESLNVADLASRTGTGCASWR